MTSRTPACQSLEGLVCKRAEIHQGSLERHECTSPEHENGELVLTLAAFLRCRTASDHKKPRMQPRMLGPGYSCDMSNAIAARALLRSDSGRREPIEGRTRE
jgi:hypothetical protein